MEQAQGNKTPAVQRNTHEVDRLVAQALQGYEQRLCQLNQDLERRNAELEAERARWQSVVEGIADEVWLCDAQGKMSLVNLPAVTAMELEEFRDKSVEEVLEEVEILYPDGRVRPAEEAPLLRSLRGEIVRGEEIMRHRRTGKTRYRQFSSAPTRDATGAITGAVAIVRDITQQKKAQEEREWLLHQVNVHAAQLQEASERLAVANADLAATNEELRATTEELQGEVEDRKQAQEALRESEERFRTLADANPLIIWVIDSTGRVQFINRAFCEFFGTSLEKVQAEGWQTLVHPDDAPTYTKPFFESLQEHKPYHAEGRVRRYDGQWRWIESWGEPRFSASGEFLGIAGSSPDITERKQAEEALREWNATLENKIAQRTAELQHRAKQLQKLTLQLSQAEEQERRRIAIILHEDLQQQIAGAKFHLSLVRGRAQEDRQRTDIDAVDEMLKGAIEKSRTLSRDLSPAVLHMNDLAEVLQWLTDRLRAQQGLSVDLTISGDMMLHSEALATFLFRAAQEMLSNVVKHAYVREAALRVRRIGHCVYLSVSDSGRGFDPRELQETPGMGLFSIRERTELLGGRLKVKSVKGKGSKFSLMVPDGLKSEDRRQKTQDGRPEGEDGLPSSVLRHPSSSSALRVLLVDDHDVVRAGLAALLREAPGIELVGEAPDGRAAIDLANDLQPDVVIMDVSMPLIGGDQATRQIKAHRPQTRVIALSMYDEAEKKRKMFEAGVEGYILKTVSAEELLAAIRGTPRHLPETAAL